MRRSLLLLLSLSFLPAVRADAQTYKWTKTRKGRVCRDAKGERGLNLVAVEEIKPGADLECSDLIGADLRGLRIAQVKLAGSDLRGADLGRAWLIGCDLREADLSSASLRGAVIGGGSQLTRANLAGADLNGARVEDAYLRGADLRGASLLSAKLIRVKLVDADLRGADLSAGLAHCSDLTGSRIEGLKLRLTHFSNTTWPPGVDFHGNGMIDDKHCL